MARRDIITRQAIRRSSFCSVYELTDTIRRFIGACNERVQPFAWTKTAGQILMHALFERPGRWRFVFLHDPRQVNRERRTLAGLASHAYPSAALAHNAVHRRKAQPGPMARALCGEERLEDPGLHRVVHPDPGVLDGQLDVRPGRCILQIRGRVPAAGHDRIDDDGAAR